MLTLTIGHAKISLLGMIEINIEINVTKLCVCVWLCRAPYISCLEIIINGSQLAKMKKSIPDMFLP